MGYSTWQKIGFKWILLSFILNSLNHLFTREKRGRLRGVKGVNERRYLATVVDCMPMRQRASVAAPWEIEFFARECVAVACRILMHRDAPPVVPVCRAATLATAEDNGGRRANHPSDDGTVMRCERHNRVAFCYLDNAGLCRSSYAPTCYYELEQTIRKQSEELERARYPVTIVLAV